MEILDAFMGIFKKYSDPKLSNADKLVLEKIKDCLQRKEKSNEDPLRLSKSLQIIIQEQDALKKVAA